MATLEELEARLAELETTVSKIKSCTCDPSNYASSGDMRVAQMKVDGLETALGNTLNKIGTLPEGKTLVEYINEKAASGGLTEGEIKAIVNAAMSATPAYKLPYTAAEFANKLGSL
jgi:hypothetical protein